MEKTFEKKEKVKKEKPRYGIASNCAYMIRNAWREYKGVLVIAAGIVLCGVVSNLLELFVVPAILDMVERGVGAGAFVRMIAAFTLGMMSVQALQSYLNTNAIFGRISVRSAITLGMHLRLCRTSFPHIEDPEYLKRVQKAAKALESNSEAAEAIWTTMTNLLTSIGCFAAYLALLARVGTLVAVMCIVFPTAGYFVNKHFESYRYQRREEEGELLNKLHYVMQCGSDTTLGKDMRIFGLAPWLTELYDTFTRTYYAFYEKCEWRILWGRVIDLALVFLRNGAAYGLLIASALRGEVTAAQFVLYFTAVSAFTQQVTGIFSHFSNLHRQSLDISAMRESCDIPEPFRFEEGKPLAAKPGHAYTLELRDVSLRYPGAEKDTLSHVNLTIRPGEKIAVVGKNGAGKTTLVKLLCGLYDPTEGQVLLDGEDIRQYNRRDYYTLFSAVFQNFSVLAGTVAENVAQTQGAKVDTARVWSCLERAGLAEKIRSLPKAENTLLDRSVYLDAEDLSGGQLQRLMLARMLYKDAPIVLLDEPTAALDPIAESELYQKYNDLTGHCTSVYISHRLASTRFCDRVLLVENGVIAEEGTHEELLAQNGRYAELFNIQSKYYQEGVMEDDA